MRHIAGFVFQPYQRKDMRTGHQAEQQPGKAPLFFRDKKADQLSAQRVDHHRAHQPGDVAHVSPRIKKQADQDQNPPPDALRSDRRQKNRGRQHNEYDKQAVVFHR